jgi:heme-degrading monooxygenase HmoA
MAELLTVPPPMDVIVGMAAIPGVAIESSVLVTQSGPDARLGPEGAGAVLMLQATFVDEERAARFWEAAVGLMELLASAPGFIRRFSFPDGPAITLIALWRTIDDAKAFAGSPEHRAAVRALYAHRWQHTHFSALWELTSNHGRIAFCECGATTPASEAACGSCGASLAVTTP